MARRLAWADRLFSTDILTGAQLILDLLSTAPDLDTITATRLIGRMLFHPNTLTGTPNRGVATMDVGIGVVSEEAFLAGVVPDPLSEAEAPARGWLYRTRMAAVFSNGNAIENENHLWPELMFDVRAMRKVDKGRLVFIVNNSLAVEAGVTVTVTGIVRTLCMT